MRSYKPKVGILGCCLAGILELFGAGCADNSQMAAIYSSDGVVSLGHRRENSSLVVSGNDEKLEGRLRAYQKVGQFELDNLRLQGSKCEKNTESQNKQERSFKVFKSIPLSDAEDVKNSYFSINVNASLDKNEATIYNNGAVVNTDTEVTGVGIGCDFIPYDKNFRVEFGYNSQEGKTKVETQVGTISATDSFDTEVNQYSAGAEMFFEDRRVIGPKSSLGLGVTLNSDDESIDSRFEGELWNLYRLNDKSAAGFHLSRTHSRGDEVTLMFGSGNIGEDNRLNAMRNYLRNRTDLEGTINKFGLVSSVGVDLEKIDKTANVTYFTVTLGKDHKDFGIAGMYMFNQNPGVYYEVSANLDSEKDETEIEGSAGVVLNF